MALCGLQRCVSTAYILFIVAILFIRQGLPQLLSIRDAISTSWTFLDSNQGQVGYEPTTLTIWVKGPKLPDCPTLSGTTLIPRLWHCLLAKLLHAKSRAGSWERVELNHHCLPLGNRFTVCRNTANRYRFPKSPTITAMFPRFEFHIRANILFEMIRRERTIRIWTATKP